MTEQVTRAELARRLGVSRPAVGKYVSKGLISVDENGCIDYVAACEAIKNKVQRSDSKSLKVLDGFDTKSKSSVPKKDVTDPPPNSNDLGRFHDARTLREATEAKIAIVRLNEMTGNLVLVAELEKSLYTAQAHAQNALRSMPDRLAALLSAETDEIKVREILNKEIDDICQSIANCKIKK